MGLWDSAGMHVLQRISPVWWLLGAYVLLTLITLATWDVRGVYGLTGDEPHYLVMTDSLLGDQTLELTSAYGREFASPTFYSLGLASVGVEGPDALGPPAAHVVQTAQGYFSWHGWGVPFLAALVLPWAGVVGVKVVMAAAGVVVIVSAWIIAGLLGARASHRVGMVAAVAVAYPLLLASGQIFPDLWAGALALVVFVWLLNDRWRQSTWATAAAGVSVGALPWLGMKFALAAVILAAGVLVVALRRVGVSSVVWFVVPLGLLGGALVAYHVWAFGSLLGPPTEGALEFGRDFWMLLPGLLSDQNQGLLFFNPALWLALPGVVLLWRRTRMVGAIWTAVFLAIWIPGAAHPGLYGMGSFNGRYAWALACLAVVPALVGFAALFTRAPRAAWMLSILAMVFQVYLWVLGTFVSAGGPGLPGGLDLYTRPISTWLESYSAWWFPIQGFLPAWYNSEWAFTFWPNVVWLLLGVLAVSLALGERFWGIARSRWRVGAVGAGALVVIAGLVATPGPRSEEVLVSTTVEPGAGPAGFIAEGALRDMRAGPYTWGVEYLAPGSAPVGKWELIRGLDGAVVASGEITGSGGEPTWTGATLGYRALVPREYFLRIGWYGNTSLRVDALTVDHGDR